MGRANSEETLRRTRTFDEAFGHTMMVDEEECMMPVRCNSETLPAQEYDDACTLPQGDAEREENEAAVRSMVDDMFNADPNQLMYVDVEEDVAPPRYVEPNPLAEIMSMPVVYEDFSMPVPPVVQPEPAQSGIERCVYIDRISPDLSDSRIIAAITNEVSPKGVQKVQSLEVIRTQKSRHVHAFAILTMRCELPGPTEIAVPGGDFIKVQNATKQLQIPPSPQPCRTLHIRIYGQRQCAWTSSIVRMTWGGMLSLLETVSPGVSNNISMVADDQSPRSNVSHPTVLLSVFFCECPTVEHAMRVRQAVHDQSTRGLDENLFLLRADYAKGEKKLHDTSDNQSSLCARFEEAKAFALSVGAGSESSWAQCDGKNCRLAADGHMHRRGLCHSFVFGDKRSDKKKRNQGDARTGVHSQGVRNQHKYRRTRQGNNSNTGADAQVDEVRRMPSCPNLNATPWASMMAAMQ